MSDEIKKNKPWYKKWWFILICVIFVLYLIGSLANTDKKNTTSKNVTEDANNTPNQQQKTEVTIKVTSQQLINDYEKNEVAADQKYKDKMVEITGIVETIGKDILDTPYVSLKAGSEYSITSVQCMFQKTEEGELAKLSKNQSVVLTGRLSGKTLNILVNDCKIK